MQRLGLILRRPLSTDGVRCSLQVFGMVPFPWGWVKDAIASPELSARWMGHSRPAQRQLRVASHKAKDGVRGEQVRAEVQRALGDVSVRGRDGKALGSKRVAQSAHAKPVRDVRLAKRKRKQEFFQLAACAFGHPAR
jgi:hypothetical protein